MPYHTDDIIVAIASAPGGAARGIVRVSGPSVMDCLSPFVTERGRESFSHLKGPSVATIFDGEKDSRPLRLSRPTVFIGNWHSDEFAHPLPATLYLWPTNRSFTRQPLAELHTLGSPPLLEAVVQSLCGRGARLAEAGEFTMRAFLAGRIDLTQAEAVLGVIDAHGEGQLAGALAQLAGGLSAPLDRLRSTLLDLLAHLEAGLDFVEEDIKFITAEELHEQLQQAAMIVGDILKRVRQRAITHDEVPIVLIGLPNAGKSSLLNALAGDEAAIVSPQAGTTRDYVTRRIVCNGIACRLIDTAGREDHADAASIAGHAQQIAGAQSQQAALRLLCIDASRAICEAEGRELKPRGDDSRLVVFTKCDLVEDTGEFRDGMEIFTSAKSGEGLDELRTAIAVAIDARHEDSSSVVGSTCLRCRESLHSAAESLARACDLVRVGHGEELVAAELRVALAELGAVVGAVYTDDILDRIFSRFCIGK